MLNSSSNIHCNAKARLHFVSLCLSFSSSLSEWLLVFRSVSLYFLLRLCVSTYLAAPFFCLSCPPSVAVSLQVSIYVCLRLHAFLLVSLCLPVFPFEAQAKVDTDLSPPDLRMRHTQGQNVKGAEGSRFMLPLASQGRPKIGTTF